MRRKGASAQPVCFNTGHVQVVCSTCDRTIYECACTDVVKRRTVAVCKTCFVPRTPLDKRTHLAARRQSAPRRNDAVIRRR